MNSKIDTDLIKDEQNPMYQNLNIQRQRLISILDRSLEKICIAYVLDEILTKHLSFVSNHVTKQELDSILTLYRYAQHLDESPQSIQNTVMQRSTLFKFGRSRTINSSFNIAKKSTTMIRPPILSPSLQIESELGIWQTTALVRSYFNSVIVKLHYVPQITNLAKYMILKKPLGSIKYYVYLKDLRDYVIKIIYQTKTDAVNYKKNIKRAYLKNQKEKPQAEAMNKVLEEKQNEKNVLEIQITNDIKNEKLIQAKINEQLMCDVSNMIKKSEDEFLVRSETNRIIQEANKVKLAETTACYNKQLDEDLRMIRSSRKKVRKLEVCYKKILEEYDNTIGELHEEYEIINEAYLKVTYLYKELERKFKIQEVQYVEVMEERDHFIEMTCLRIRYKIATQIIQRWWRQILQKRRKWRKTYLASQLNRKSLAPQQRQTMKRILKRILKKQNRANKNK